MKRSIYIQLGALALAAFSLYLALYNRNINEREPAWIDMAAYISHLAEEIVAEANQKCALPSPDHSPFKDLKTPVNSSILWMQAVDGYKLILIGEPIDAQGCNTTGHALVTCINDKKMKQSSDASSTRDNGKRFSTTVTEKKPLLDIWREYAHGGTFQLSLLQTN